VAGVTIMLDRDEPPRAAAAKRVLQRAAPDHAGFQRDVSRLVDMIPKLLAPNPWKGFRTKLETLHRLSSELLQLLADPAVDAYLHPENPHGTRDSAFNDLPEMIVKLHEHVRPDKFSGVPSRQKGKPKSRRKRPVFDDFVCWVFETARRHNIKLTITRDVNKQAGGTLAVLLRKLDRRLPPGFVPKQLKATSLKRAVRLGTLHALYLVRSGEEGGIWPHGKQPPPPHPQIRGRIRRSKSTK
jgi:hypothetical protein